MGASPAAVTWFQRRLPRRPRKTITLVDAFVTQQASALGVDVLTVQFGLRDNFQRATQFIRVIKREIRRRAGGRSNDLDHLLVTLVDFTS